MNYFPGRIKLTMCWVKHIFQAKAIKVVDYSLIRRAHCNLKYGMENCSFSKMYLFTWGFILCSSLIFSDCSLIHFPHVQSVFQYCFGCEDNTTDTHSTDSTLELEVLKQKYRYFYCVALFLCYDGEASLQTCSWLIAVS